MNRPVIMPASALVTKDMQGKTVKLSLQFRTGCVTREREITGKLVSVGSGGGVVDPTEGGWQLSFRHDEVTAVQVSA